MYDFKKKFEEKQHVLLFLCGNFDPLLKLDFGWFEAGVLLWKCVIIQFKKYKTSKKNLWTSKIWD